MEELLKIFREKLSEGAEIRVTPSSTAIKGSEPAVMAMLSSLIHNLAYKVDGVTKEMVEYAVKLGLESDEEIEAKKEVMKEEVKSFDEISKILDKMKEIADKLED
jgi:hypothetical protein